MADKNENLKAVPKRKDERTSVTAHTHGSGEAHAHGSGAHRHVHTPEENKPILDRLARAIGHLESVRRMVVDGRDCSEVLIQLSAVRAALNRTGLIILKNHIDQCIVEAVASGDTAAVDELNDAISKFLK